MRGEGGVWRVEMEWKGIGGVRWMGGDWRVEMGWQRIEGVRWDGSRFEG